MNRTGRVVLYGILALAALLAIGLSWENYVAEPGLTTSEGESGG
jgi:hypothetical protein